ncbi:MAG: SIS domain-containing protein [Christensenellaceae bacterium]|nr:SIS domain-containing protein [Christensenellaceae bacterium]
MKKERVAEISAIIEKVAAKKTINHIYLVGCGASYSVFRPVEYYLNLETEMPTTAMNAGEFNHATPRALGEDSLVVTCSHSGTTPETVAATKMAREKGALTVSFCDIEAAGSPLEKEAEYTFHYEWGDDIDMSDGKEASLYYFMFGVLNILAPSEKYKICMENIHKLGPVVAKNRNDWDQTANDYARAHKKKDLVYTMASGSSYGACYIYSICLMMEMQWVKSQAIHSGEYFHGPFEMTDEGVPFIVVLGVDECRPVDERALAFCKKFSDDVHVIDCATFDMMDVAEEAKGYFANIVLTAVLRRHAAWLAEHRGHPFTVRRYMWKMDY